MQQERMRRWWPNFSSSLHYFWKNKIFISKNYNVPFIFGNIVSVSNAILINIAHIKWILKAFNLVNWIMMKSNKKWQNSPVVKSLPVIFSEAILIIIIIDLENIWTITSKTWSRWRVIKNHGVTSHLASVVNNLMMLICPICSLMQSNVMSWYRITEDFVSEDSSCWPEIA